jgi:hypothetical protein
MDTLNDTRGSARFDDILADFELLDDWEDRSRACASARGGA